MRKMLSTLLFGAILIVSCSKNNNADNKDDIATQPMITPHGAATGPLVSASIGAQGGQLATADGRMKIIVPAGAVTTAQNFGIQPVESTFRPGKPTNRSFRLYPEGITFSKPVTVVIQYDPAEITKGVEDILQVATQDATGTWKPMPTALDKAAHTLTVQTTHFSDFDFYDRYEIFSNEVTAMAGERVMFKIGCTDNDLLAPLNPYIDAEFDNGKGNAYLPITRSEVTAVSWRIVEGGGTIVAQNNGYGLDGHAQYQAPAKIESPKEVIIEATLDGNVPIPDPSAPGGMRKLGRLIIQKTITLVPESSVFLTLDGKEYWLNDGAYGAAENGQTSVGGSNGNVNMSFSLNVGAISTGGFSCGPTSPGSGKAFIAISYAAAGGSTVVAATNYCVMEGSGSVPKYSGGTVNITRLGPVGGMIEGTWSGSVYAQKPNTGECQYEVKNLTARFYVKRLQ